MLHFLQTNETNSVYNACEMGLGKCAQAITCLNALHINTALIICPAVMRLVWLEELKKWYEVRVLRWDNIGRVLFNRGDLATWGNYGITIVSYNLAATTQFLEKFKQLDGMYEALIIDESHYCKNKRANRTKAVLNEIWPKCKYKIALSGTPFTKSVIDGYTLFNKMLPSKFPSFTKFAYRYSYQEMTPWGPKYFGVKNDKELSNVIRSNFYIRYKKEDVLTDLPPKVFQKITLPNSYSVQVDEETEREMTVAIAALNEGRPVAVKAHLATHRRAQGLAKVDPVVEYVEQLLEQEIPVVLFGYHRDVIKQYYDKLIKYAPVVIIGESSAKNRQDAISKFQSGGTDLFIGNLTAAGIGITLTRSSNVVLGEMDWSPSVISQAVDRCHRIGAKDTVNVHYFVVKDSLDEKLTNIIMSKASAFKKVVD